MNRTHRLAVMLLAAATASLALFAGQASADTNTFGSGTATLPSGSPAPGAEVDLYVADYASMTDGQTVTMTPLSSTTADSTGHYTLSAPIGSSAVTAAAAANNGYVNFEQDTISANGQMSVTYYSEQLAGGTWSAGEADGPPSTVNLSMATGTLSPFTADPCPGNPKVTLLNHANGWTSVSEVHTAADQNDQVGYGRQNHASTNIEVAISSNDIGFSASGTNYRSDSATVNWPLVGSEVGKRATSLFKYGHFKTFYPCGGVTVYSKRSMSWQGGDNWGQTNHDLDHHCSDQHPDHSAPFLPGSSFTKIQGNGVTWSTGVSVLGLSLTSKTGWGQNNTSVWHFGRHYSQYWLCGDTAGPVGAQRVFAGL